LEGAHKGSGGNLMYVCTLKVAGDRRGLTAQPQNAEIATSASSEAKIEWAAWSTEAEVLTGALRSASGGWRRAITCHQRRKLTDV